MFLPRIRDGEYTAFIYDKIAAGKYDEVVGFLRVKAETNPNSRAIHSILGWCFLALQDFVSAADCYERLTVICPENNSYWLYYGQCLNKAGFPSEALKIVNFVAAKSDPETVALLKASIRFQDGEIPESKALLDKCSQKNPVVLSNQGSACFQERDYNEAAAKFSASLSIGGFRPSLGYALGATYFELKDFRQATKHCNEVISKALNTHPEFAQPFQIDGEPGRFFKNSPALQEAYLIEAFNLKAAIDYEMNNYTMAKSSLNSIPPRTDQDIDMITLHNRAILHAEADAEESIQMLTHIVSQPMYPKETLSNLITMYFKEEQFDVAADFMAENIETCYTQLPEDIYSYFEAVIIQQTSPEEAYVRLEELILRYQEQLKKLSNQEKIRRREGSSDKLKAVETEYDQVLLRLLNVVMSQAVMYWEHRNYVQVERQLKRAHEYLSDQQVWRTNMAHTLFMLENYQEASKFYETIIRGQLVDLLKLSPVLLANLCVSYVMTSRNDEAEEILRRVEEAEERTGNQSPDLGGSYTKDTSSHLCMINLVIGTLYCSKGNFTFGLSRILRSFEPAVAQKLDQHTWTYAKPVLLAVVDKLLQHELTVQTKVLDECIQLLTQTEDAGKLIPCNGSDLEDTARKSTVATEARLLKKLFLTYCRS